MKLIRKFRTKPVAYFLLGVFALYSMPLNAKSANGPDQPETVSFTPSDITQMVDPFTGDFTYNINLLDVGGYPINLSYRSGIHPEDQASWVGLGWNVNPGAINRQVRGLPDDFNGDEIIKDQNIKDDETFGINTGIALEVFGFDAEQFAGSVELSLSLGVNYNNYIGYGIDFGVTPSFNFGSKMKNGKLSGSLNAELSLGVNSNYGTSISPNVGLSFNQQYKSRESTYGIGVGLSYSSRSGLDELNFKTSFKDKAKYTQSYGKSFSLSMANPTYTPEFEMPKDLTSFSFRMKLGAEGLGVIGGISGGLYYSKSELQSHHEKIPSYGYIYEQNAGNGRVLHDINRENDGPFQEDVPVLPLTNFTNDIFNVSAQGLSGSFRPFRGDFGMVSDTKTNSTSLGGNIGAEIGAGNLVHVGVDIVVNKHDNTTQKWEENNAIAANLAWNTNPSSPEFEPIYFKNPGEFTQLDNRALFDIIGGYEAVNVPIGNDNTESKLINRFKDINEIIGPNQNFRTERVPRSTLFSTLTAKEARETGTRSYIESYNPGLVEDIDDSDTQYEFGFDRINRINEFRKEHHISEILVTNQDGNRFVYGIPVYQKEISNVSFNVSGITVNNELVQYQPGVDNSVRNRNGIDHYYSKTTTPGHATSFLLTTILSTDYVDITGNGPSSDDFGTYTKFNYQKVLDNYRWRTPFAENTANYNEAHMALPNDDMAVYSYGEKEIWYLHSIESKNYIAEFSISDRDDGIGVLGENGGGDPSQRIKKLDEIALYAKADRLKNGPSAIPIKKVYFEYDYSLCPDIPDQVTPGQGKLTLKKVSYSFGTSLKEKRSPYIFEYNSENYPYNHLTKDRWANYKANNEELPNSRFPYTDQDRSITDAYATAWHLTDIQLPSGGKLTVQYESDDYAYVQDKRAMEMYPIIGINKFPTFTRDSILFQDSDSVEDHSFRYLFFKLKHPTDNQYQLYEYVKGIEELYFNCLVNVSPNSDSFHQFEKVEGFIPFLEWVHNVNYGSERDESGMPTIGWIKLPLISDDDEHFVMDEGTNGSNPISKSTWQKLQKSLFHYVQGNALTLSPDDDPLAVIQEIGNFMERLTELTNTFHGEMENEERGNMIRLNQSFIRLNSPDKIKLGGGARVKKILLNDNWWAMNPNHLYQNDFSYGQEYEYTMEENVGGTTQRISSGVAAYEPLVGGEENPMVLPIRYRIRKEMALDVIKYVLEPVGESFYPHPQVGYRQVKIRNIQHEGVNQNATGHEVFQFYTAKDFPVIVKQTEMLYKPYEFMWPPFTSEKNATVSQGFTIELNNMHGVAKSKKIFQESDPHTPISSIEYQYKVSAENPKQLDNTALTINPLSNSIEEQQIGVNYDFITDGREFKSESISPGVNINTDGFIVGFVPIFFPIPYPNFSTTKSRFRSITTTKLIYRTGLLEKVIASEFGSRIVTHRQAFDGLTGKPVVSRIDDEFGGHYYKTNLPAYWTYKQMGPAFFNQGITISSVQVTDGRISSEISLDLFEKGDVLSMDPTTPPDIIDEEAPDRLGEADILGEADRLFTVEELHHIRGETDRLFTVEHYHPNKAWVYHKNEREIRIINQVGNPYPSGEYNLKIIRSGNRNLLSASMGETLTKEDPIRIRDGKLQFERVLEASSHTYSGHWQTYLGFTVPEILPQCNCSMISMSFPNLASAFTGPGPSILTELISYYNSLVSEGALISDGTPLDGSSSALSRFLERIMGEDPITYHAQIRGPELKSMFFNGELASTCRMDIAMEDGSAFPESIIDFSMDENPYVLDHDFACTNLYSFRGKIRFNDPVVPERIREEPVIFTSSCFPIFVCQPQTTVYSPESCGLTEGNIVNPYLVGILGNWRPLNSYKYITNRVSGPLARNGHFEQFHNFWIHSLIEGDVRRDLWQEATQSVIVDPNGKSLMTKNPLDIPTSQLYGFAYAVPTVSVDNAAYHDIGYEGFEDHQYQNIMNSPFDECPLPQHFSYDSDAIITNEESHTGKFSIEVTSNQVLERQIQAPCDSEEGSRSIASPASYRLRDCDLIRSFSPTPGAYLVSAWVKEQYTSDFMLNYEDASIAIGFTGGGTATSFMANGPIIDGWQRIEGRFTLPEGVTSIQVTLSTRGRAWFDDIRIQPVQSRMNAYVYDPKNLALKAILNESNYATYFEYDHEGKLIRKKVETEQGIKTIQEVNFAKFKSE